MKLISFILGLAVVAVSSPVAELEERQTSNGDGPYAPAGYQTIGSLSGHTIYRPNNAAAAGAMPVFVWGNGGCGADGTSARNFLTQIASYGFLVVASGNPGGSGSTTVQMMADSITWAANGAGDAFNVNTKKIMVAGYSCGGTEAYNFINDARVTTIGIFSSGYLSNYDLARTIKKPIMFALGGPNDIAYGNGERDYSYLPSETSAWLGNLNRVGHGGTYSEYNGGLFAKAGYKWAQWLLKDDASAGAYFMGNTAVADGWSDEKSKNLGSIGGSNPTTTSTTVGGSTTSGPTTSPTSPGSSCAMLWGQCGGIGWTGATCCSQSTCKYSNNWYSQCL